MNSLTDDVFTAYIGIDWASAPQVFLVAVSVRKLVQPNTSTRIGSSSA